LKDIERSSLSASADSRTNLDLDSQTIRTTKLRLDIFRHGSIENLLAMQMETPVDIAGRSKKKKKKKKKIERGKRRKQKALLPKTAKKKIFRGHAAAFSNRARKGHKHDETHQSGTGHALLLSHHL
jgi:hypothetical protein